MTVADYVRDVADRLPDADRVASAVEEYSASGGGKQPRLYELEETGDGYDLTDSAMEQYKEDLETGDVRIVDVNEDGGFIVAEYREEEQSPVGAAYDGFKMMKALNRGKMPWNMDSSQKKSRKDDSGMATDVAAHLLGDGLYDKITGEASG